jgi:hypothetical protein
MVSQSLFAPLEWGPKRGRLRFAASSWLAFVCVGFWLVYSLPVSGWLVDVDPKSVPKIFPFAHLSKFPSALQDFFELRFSCFEVVRYRIGSL